MSLMHSRLLHLKPYLLFLGLLLATHCNAQKPAPRVSPSTHMGTQYIALGSGKILVLADSTDAARWIVQDKYDHFFERVSIAEISIQMQQPLLPNQTREDLLPAFQQYLKGDMASFSEQEATYTHSAMKQVFQQCQAVDTDIFPDTIILLKTHGKHYGEGVYYTRNNYIIVPADAFVQGHQEGFVSTMFHETFHVYSRLNPEKRRQLYQLIGFSDIGYENLEMPQALRERLLHNPDGVNFAQRITLQTKSGSTIHAIPIIYANELGMQSDRTAFMSYLSFGLFEIKPVEGTQHWRVVTRENGYDSTLDMKNLPDFQRQIRDNTGYIIHPDEVLADNFSFVMRGRTKPEHNQRFSPAGKELLRLVEKILTE